MSTATNGLGKAEHVAEFHDLERRQGATVESIVADLELAIQAERDGRAEIEEYVRQSKARESHLRRALTVLDPGAADNAQAPTAKPKAKAAAQNSNTWSISEERVAVIYEQFKAWLATEPEGPLTKTRLAEWINEQAKGQGQAGVAHGTVGKAMDVLRERELVRVTGTTTGGGKTWALMPDAP
jgi:ribosomal protein L3